MPKVIPFKDTILVRRRKIKDTLKDGKTEGGIYMPQTTEERSIDLADVIEVPELTFEDKALLDNAEGIVEGLAKKAREGNGQALKSMQEFCDFLKRKSIKVGDGIFLSRYAGTDFRETGKEEIKTLIKVEDIIGLVVDNET